MAIARYIAWKSPTCGCQDIECLTEMVNFAETGPCSIVETALKKKKTWKCYPIFIFSCDIISFYNK